jgi:3-oxoadipate enol-lactonase
MHKIDTTAGRAQVRDGTGIAYTLYRNAESDQRAVLVHSLAMDQNFWKPVAAHLGQRASILLYDCRGRRPTAWAIYGRVVRGRPRDLLAHVGWNSALVAGASMEAASRSVRRRLP